MVLNVKQSYEIKLLLLSREEIRCLVTYIPSVCDAELTVKLFRALKSPDNCLF